VIPSRFGKRLAGAHDALPAGPAAASELNWMARSLSRTLGSGSRRVVVLAAALLASGGVLAGVLLSESGEPAARAAALKYGTLPSWLPKAKIPVGRLVNASAAHPWLAIQGDTVSVNLAHGRVLATAVGPAVVGGGDDDEGGPDTVVTTFTVTFTDVRGSVPLSAKAFTLYDEAYAVPVRVSASGGGPPRSVAPGQTLSLTVHATLSEGGGVLRWSPLGGMAIVSWDYGLETD
jgi:hypothetical protein